MPITRHHVLTIAALLSALFFALTAVSVWQSWQYQTRGIPPSLPEPIPHGRAQLGMNVALEQYDDAELAQVLDELAALGIPYLKQNFYYRAEDWDWAQSDRLFTAVSAHPNLTLVPLLNGDPANNFAPPADKAAFAQWAGTFAQRYGAETDFYIIWDEPNLTTQWGNLPVNPAEYAALLTAVSPAIKAADPTALIIAAPLAPTSETGPQNLADHLYLQRLYEAGAEGAFDVVMGKPYGFDTGPDDRRVANEVLNFSRLILLREVLARNGAGHTAVWAGNWGWHSLPPDWTGAPSVWGQTDPDTQMAYLIAGLNRAQTEWPWAGILFIEGWEHPQATAPQSGFNLRHHPRLADLAAAQQASQAYAYSGFHFARPDDPHQTFSGGWEFSPLFGADASEVAEGDPPDRVTFDFWGTEVGLRVRRADFRARFYLLLDGQPANALPQDEHGAVLVLTAADPAEDYISTELVARNLPPGPHRLELIASRGWDQWALQGFAVQSRPDFRPYGVGMSLLLALAVGFVGLAVWAGRQVSWSVAPLAELSERAQLWLTAIAAAVTALTGWLVWGEGLFRRMGDLPQLALVAATAVTFYITPWFWLYLLALGLFALLVYYRPPLALPIIAFAIPFYVPSVLKPIFQYQFSPVEIFTLTAVVATTLSLSMGWLRRRAAHPAATPLPRWRPNKMDTAVLLFLLIATLSLLFTARLDVATNEWRMVILEPTLFYFLIRASRPTANDIWRMLDGLILGGLLVALIGLGQYLTGSNLITAEAGLMRLRSIYGSPNNVALYLGRILPLLLALWLMGQALPSWRRWGYGATAVVFGLTILLTFSKGALLLGVPLALLTLFVCWQKQRERPVWPWLILFALLALIGYALILQIPALALRLDPRSMTGFLRLNLWRASLNMIQENPLFGVGLDNFLYAYRSRYIFDAAWPEPNLNHPHNLLLDFATRLGLLGLLAGLWLWGVLFWSLGRTVRLRLRLRQFGDVWWPVGVGLLAGLVHALGHGLVDHSFFLVDLAFWFYLVAGTAVFLETHPHQPNNTS
jgi:O-antigen ligase